ncbi:MAG: ABC transporter ATP-binding protein [SAR202 cluster bacterium]|jgi:putative ABC transport system ATP-binding protein|nr:ABC transporter ATP-binding protein [SAR202 cluster bacterium]MDP6513458.1 ABC transporter ATP-binding protein [SAR202 cluster bacterium]MDP6713066.1 ABC transporter ATP-binding protein [SAR202 cluster bacterium]
MSNNNGYIINANNVMKTYRSSQNEVSALQGVDLQIKRGEMVAVMGPSGCGKTTLLNCLSGLDTIDGGEVLLEGESIHDMPDRKRTELRRSRMGFVFQSFNLLPVLSAVQNVELPLIIGGTDRKEAHKQSKRMLELVDLGDRLDHRPMELSGGEQQRVAIARALVTTPAIVWADEPTGNLDSERSGEIMDLLTQLNQEHNQAIIMVTHDAGIGQQAHRIIRMRDGQIESEE